MLERNKGSAKKKAIDDHLASKCTAYTGPRPEKSKRGSSGVANQLLDAHLSGACFSKQHDTLQEDVEKLKAADEQKQRDIDRITCTLQRHDDALCAIVAEIGAVQPYGSIEWVRDVSLAHARGMRRLAGAVRLPLRAQEDHAGDMDTVVRLLENRAALGDCVVRALPSAPTAAEDMIDLERVGAQLSDIGAVHDEMNRLNAMLLGKEKEVAALKRSFDAALRANGELTQRTREAEVRADRAEARAAEAEKEIDVMRAFKAHRRR